MKTTKPCSTISYNSTEFLTVRLNDLIDRRVIDFYAFIEHLPEEDEKKAHKHIFIVPNGKIDTDQIKDYLVELNPLDIGKPLGCIWFNPSKFDDWYFYELHDTEYLASRGQSRKYHYTEDEFYYSSEDYFTQLKHRIDYSKIGNRKTKQVIEELNEGQDLVDLLNRGLISPQNFMQWEKIYNAMTYRAGRKTHTPIGEDEYITEEGVIEYDPIFCAQVENAFDEKKAQASKPKGTK